MKKLNMFTLIFFLFVLTINLWSQATMVAAYEFSGNTNDATVNNLNLTSFGGSYVNDRFGDTLSAFELNSNSGDYLKNTSQSILPSGAMRRAVSLWFKMDPLSSSFSNSLISWGDGSVNNAFGIALGTPWGTPAGINVYGWGNDALFSFPYNSQDWYHLVASFDDDSVKVYINSILIGAKAKPNWNTTSPSDLRIGTTSPR